MKAMYFSCGKETVDIYYGKEQIKLVMTIHLGRDIYHSKSHSVSLKKSPQAKITCTPIVKTDIHKCQINF